MRLNPKILSCPSVSYCTRTRVTQCISSHFCNTKVIFLFYKNSQKIKNGKKIERDVSKNFFLKFFYFYYEGRWSVSQLTPNPKGRETKIEKKLSRNNNNFNNFYKWKQLESQKKLEMQQQTQV